MARSLGYYDESIWEGTAALDLEPDGPSNLALSCELYGLYQKVREHYEHAATLCPGDAGAQQKGGVACLFTGAKDEAKQYFEKAIGLKPRLASASRAIANINKYVATEHEDFARMQALLAARDGTDDDRCQCHFALGKMCEDCGEDDRAFEHFDAGNRLANRKHDFDPSEYHPYANRLIMSFLAKLISSMASSRHTGSQPMFIFGMPHSGTTLVEHIMACHAEVYGAGELPWFVRLESALPSFLESAQPYPECVVEMAGQAYQLLAGKYLDYLGDLGQRQFPIQPAFSRAVR